MRTIMDMAPNDPVSGKDYPAGGTIKSPILLFGDIGGIARDVAGCLQQAGWPVATVHLSRPPAGEADGAALARAAHALRRPLGGMVALFGGSFRPGRLLDHDSLRLRDKLDEDVVSHLIAARSLLPVLVKAGRPSTYLILGGPAAESPWSGYGHLSVAAAALRSLVQVLSDETRTTPVRVRQLSVCTPIRTERNRDHACVDWPNAFEVGHRIAELLASPPGEAVACLQRRRRPHCRPGLSLDRGPDPTPMLPSEPSP